jgi:hypothetical protein
MIYVNFIIQKFKSLDNFSKWNLFIGGTMILTVLLLYFKYKSFEERFHLSMVPDELNVTTIINANDQGLGLGPGDNEAGLIAYELPDNVSTEIKKNGISYFFNMPPQKGENREGRGEYSSWQQTPLPSTPNLENKDQDKEITPTTSTLKISSYLAERSFVSIKIDPLIENQIDSALSKSGSYVGYGYRGIIIIIPDIKRVFYAYGK